jgi:hypothetical protein
MKEYFENLPALVLSVVRQIQIDLDRRREQIISAIHHVQNGTAKNMISEEWLSKIEEIVDTFLVSKVLIKFIRSFEVAKYFFRASALIPSLITTLLFLPKIYPLLKKICPL